MKDDDLDDMEIARSGAGETKEAGCCAMII